MVELKRTKEMRQVYGDTMADLMQHNQKVVLLDADLASSSGAGDLFEQFPNRCIDVGISEQNMISVGAGLSLTGLTPYAHTFAPFISRRDLDQIYVSLGFAQASMHLLGSDPGFWSQFNGGTHTTFEDLAMLRAIPNITVTAPSDPISYEWILRDYEKRKGLAYTRVTRKPLPYLYETGTSFEYGKAKVLKEGKDAAVFTIGGMTHTVLNIAQQLEDENLQVMIIDLLYVQPYDQERIRQIVTSHPLVFTVENHNVIGGIGDIVASEIAESGANAQLTKIGVKNRFGEVGTVEYLQEQYGLGKDRIYREIKERLR